MDIIDYLKSKNYNGLDDKLAIKTDLRSYDITVSYDNTVNNGKRRFIFTSSNKTKKAFSHKICVEANGLILEAPDWNILVMPVFSRRSDVDTTVMNDILSKQLFDISYIEDGSVINLYYYKDRKGWLMASNKGIDIENNILNTMTYTQMFDEALTKMGITPDTFYNSLDKNKSYTFGFKHPDIHPFMEGKQEKIYKVWFVQAVNIKNLIPSDTDVEKTICAIYQENIIKTSPFVEIPTHTPIKFGFKSMTALYSKLKKAFDNFMDYQTTMYGFLLTAKNLNGFENNMDYCSIQLNSSLMNYIKRLWYNNIYVKHSKLNNVSRQNIILINSFLDNNRHEIFNILFPQYKPEFKLLNEIEYELTEKIYDKLHKNSSVINDITPIDRTKLDPALTVPLAESVNNPINTTEPSIVTDDIIDILCNLVTNYITISTHSRPKQKIRDIIHTLHSVDYFYAHFSNKKILQH